MRSKKAIINIITSLILQFVLVICGFIIPKLIIENFGSDVNGLVTSITQFLAYIALLEAGFGPVIKSLLYKPLAQKNKNQILKILKATEKFFRVISYIFIIYIIGLLFVFPVLVLDEFETFFTVSLIIIIAISTFIEYYFGMTYRLFLEAEQKAYISYIIQILTVILNTILVVVLIYNNASIHIVKLVSALIFVMRPILQNLYVKKKYNISLKGVEDNYKIKQKWDGLAQHIAAVVNNNTGVVILTIFVNTIEVSVYSVYLLVVNGIKNLVQALTGGIEATFGDMIARNEKENLNKKFKFYETIFFSLIIIIFSCTLVLILPFVNLYTQNINDVNYYRPVFAYLITLAIFMWAIRLPYSSLTLAAGHFKETMKGAWVEAIVNIVLSIVLVFKFGMVGIAIGMLVAMFIRTIEFMYHTSKYILERSKWYTFKRLIIISVEVIIILLLVQLISGINITNYMLWILQGIITAIIAVIVVLIFNLLFYKDEMKEIINFIRMFIYRKKGVEE